MSVEDSDGFQIEKKVPIPKKGQIKRIYPFGDMEIGDSFAFPVFMMRRVTNAANEYGRNNAVKFTVRQINQEVGRVWRIK